MRIWGLPCGSAGKESACNEGDLGSIPGLGRSPGEGNSYPLQYSGLENSMDCIIHGIAKSQTKPSFSWGSDITMKRFRASLDMRSCKDGDHQTVPKNIQLSEDLSHQIPWSTERLTPPWTPSGFVEGQSYSSMEFSLHKGRWQMPSLFSHWQCSW